MTSPNDDLLARLEAMMAAQEERIGRLQCDYDERITQLQAELQQQHVEKQGLVARLTDLEGGHQSHLSRAGLFKVAAAGVAGLLGAGAIENSGTGIALADSPPTTFTSTTSTPAVIANNTAADGSGGNGLSGSTQDTTHAGVAGFHPGAGAGTRGISAGGGPGVLGISNSTSSLGPGVRGQSYGNGENPALAGVAGYNLRSDNGQDLPGYGPGVFGQSMDVGVYGSSTDDSGNVGKGPGVGVYGVSGSGAGISGSSSTFDGVYGSSDSFNGVEGHSKSGDGVHGDSNQGGNGISGASYSGAGIYGTTNVGSDAIFGECYARGVHGLTHGAGNASAPTMVAGVFGESLQSAIGVLGITNQAASSSPTGRAIIPPPEIPSDASNTGAKVGVRGVSCNSTTGVAGVSFADATETTLGSGVGIQGWSGSGYGVYGNSTASCGVLGKSSGGAGVLGQSQNWYGVQGNSVYGDGVYAVSTHLYGAEVNGGKAPLRLVPSGSAGAPSASGHKAGELYVDSTGILYYFNGTAWKVVQIV